MSELKKLVIQGGALCAIVSELHPLGDLDVHARCYHLDVEDVLQATMQLCSATSFLHSMGWVHTDIKPLNILVASAKPLSIRLSDLGECSTAEEVMKDEHPYMTTVNYRAPEVILHKAHTNEESAYATDAWSIGMYLHSS